MNSLIKKLTYSLQNTLPGEAAQYKMAPYGRLLKEEALKLNTNPKLSAVLILLYPVKGAKRKAPPTDRAWRKEHYPKSSARCNTVLILRTSDHGVHSGQVSFPGGKKEESDRSLEDTALREAEEEIGIKKNDVKVIGPLSELYIPVSGFLVQPFVGYLNKKPLFYPDKNEVAKLIEVSLDLIMDDGIVKVTTLQLIMNRYRRRDESVNRGSPARPPSLPKGLAGGGETVKKTANLEQQSAIRIQKSKIKVPYFDIYGHKVWGATAMMLSELKEVYKEIGK